jgi:hypothetical protein
MALSLRRDIVLARHAPIVGQRAHHEVPGVEGRLAMSAKVLRSINLRLD